MVGEKIGPMEGRGRCRAILSRSSVAPLDVLMHVENNLTANLLHSFSFLPRALRLAPVAHLSDPSFCALSDERERPFSAVPLISTHLPFSTPEGRLRERASARAYSHLIEYVI